MTKRFFSSLEGDFMMEKGSCDTTHKDNGEEVVMEERIKIFYLPPLLDMVMMRMSLSEVSHILILSVF